jgi:hypothetical protein
VLCFGVVVQKQRMAQAYVSPWEQFKRTVAGVVGGMGTQMLLTNLVNSFYPMSALAYLPFVISLQLSGIPSKSTEILYNLMSYIWDPKQDTLLETTAQALASTKMNEKIKEELVEQIRKYKDLRIKLNNTIKAINEKKLDPTRGALNMLQLAQYLSRIRVEIARLDGNDSARLKELDDFQRILQTETQLLSQMRANKSIQRKMSLQAGDMEAFEVANDQIDAIDVAQDKIDAKKPEVAAAKRAVSKAIDVNGAVRKTLFHAPIASKTATPGKTTMLSKSTTTVPTQTRIPPKPIFSNSSNSNISAVKANGTNGNTLQQPPPVPKKSMKRSVTPSRSPTTTTRSSSPSKNLFGSRHPHNSNHLPVKRASPTKSSSPSRSPYRGKLFGAAA